MTFADAARATFLDFEATATAPHRPALVGVVSHDASFTQYILDPDLADASRARADLRVADVGLFLEQIANDLEVRDAVWCSWSTFDLAVIQNSAAPRAVRAVMERRFRNALAVVPAWAATYEFRPEREPFQSRNQLHRFFKLAGYRPDWRYGDATPAGWITHVRERMNAVDGRYRRTSRTTKRDWHRLLDYNRHDCFGLRHLALRATAEMDRRRAYVNTVYSVRDGRRAITFRIGSAKRAIDALLERSGAREWVHMTAWNPGLARLASPENRQRQDDLVAELTKRGFAPFPGAGEDPTGEWPMEDSVFIAGIRPKAARTLARKYGQWAIVAGELHQRSRLLWCLDPGRDPKVLGQLPPTVELPAIV